MKELRLFGKDCLQVESDLVRLTVTREGGHMAPVEFYYGTTSPVAPYYVCPWYDEELPDDLPKLLGILRGDFFCLPFGAENSLFNEDIPVHGETSSQEWELKGAEKHGGITVLTMEMETKSRKGRVAKQITLKDGETNIYLEHAVTGFAGLAPYGHHATLDGSRNLLISTSPVQFGLVDPGANRPYSGGEYYALLGGEYFSSIQEVPTRWKDAPAADCSRFPGRKGFVDIIQVYQQPGAFGWTSAVCREEGFMWYALKDIRVLPSTVLWMENYGRHQAPWSGRNCCIGIEDVCSYLASGMNGSCVDNEIAEAGIATCREFREDETFPVRYIQGAVRVPEGFDRVETVHAAEDRKSAEFISESGISVKVPVDLEFLSQGMQKKP